MSDYERRVYLLDPKTYSPETIAVAFARTSRSPEPFDQIAAELNDARSAEFNEKWVVGYGHSSVAEHAVLHIAMENISRLAVECVESNRLASYTEKSTRYQKWSAEAYATPPEIAGCAWEDAYRAGCGALLEAYRTALRQVGDYARALFPRREDESESRWDGRIRLKYVDVCRYLLPAASLANVGVTMNARALEHAIRKMLSHPLAEVRALGAEVKRVALAETPTLVKYANPNIYMAELPDRFRQSARSILNPVSPHAAGISIRLQHFEREAEIRALAAAAVRFTNRSYEDTLRELAALPAARQAELARTLLDSLDEHDAPLRELEHLTYTFEVVLDQGAYFEVKRHRLMTQTPGPLSFDLGYVTPRWIEAAGCRAAYDAALGAARSACEQIRSALGADVAAYLVPNAALRRLVLTFNLREAYHFCSLRASPGAHPAVRRIARAVAQQIRAVHPLLASAMNLAPEPDEAPQADSFLLD
jgi:thymidylate synthase ThyX